MRRRERNPVDANRKHAASGNSLDTNKPSSSRIPVSEAAFSSAAEPGSPARASCAGGGSRGEGPCALLVTSKLNIPHSADDQRSRCFVDETANKDREHSCLARMSDLLHRLYTCPCTRPLSFRAMPSACDKVLEKGSRRQRAPNPMQQGPDDATRSNTLKAVWSGAT
jgi:hypothetical protein